ncbi:testis-specific serine/threonine-protein kinase 4-like [Acanthaster planci]|uniref:Testis-specific serine/threonine-protein kinase 4-like n=1 Tax=Acanthaster planci TaxID=133434 RepID=A0A8B7XVG9_ACAPL|nr:testis-specific serine/threonine-protein kinase 4-like [Acanthaster planci]
MAVVSKMSAEPTDSASPDTRASAATRKNADNSAKERLSVLEQHGFTSGETVGHGSYAAVKVAYSSRHKSKVAIKIVSKRKAPEDYLRKFLPREIQVVKILKHPNLVCFLQSIETTSRVYFIMELAENGDLLDYIKAQGAVTESQAGTWFHQLVDGMEYCHDQGVVHRDLKCENILLSKNNILKITDFGFARGHMKPVDKRVILSETYCGSYAYAPPEILRGIPYDPMLGDIWSMGVVLFTMMFGRLPFDDTNHKILLQQVQKPPAFPSNRNVAEDCKDLICRILSPAKRRINISEIRENRWFRRIGGNVAKAKKASAVKIKPPSEAKLLGVGGGETDRTASKKIADKSD